MVDKRSGFFGINKNEGKTTVYRNAEVIASYTDVSPIPRRPFRARASIPGKLLGPKLKVERAKSHIKDLEAAFQTFLDSGPYALFGEENPQTGEAVVRIAVSKEIPVQWSVIIGDAVHNLRAALDCTVCDLIRLATGTETYSGGFPLAENRRVEKATRIGKIEGVSGPAKRRIMRLYRCPRWHDAMWGLHWLDIIDKHNRIIPVASAMLRIEAEVGLIDVFQGPDGSFRFGGPGPDGVPLMLPAGVPDTFKRISPLRQNAELHRIPAGVNENVHATFGIAFAQTKVFEGEPIIETLKYLADLTERTIQVFERVA
jgi:hypothetical protein